MAEIEAELKKALTELRAIKERKFDQTVDLIVNLQKFDIKKSNVNIFVSVPNKVKDKKIAGFLEVKNKDIETITPDEFKKYTNKAQLKSLVNNHDFFIAQASLNIYKGRVNAENMSELMSLGEELRNKINTSVKIKVKEPSIKIPIGKQSMKDEEIIENIMVIYNLLLKTLPRNKENIKKILILLSMLSV